MSTHTNNNSRLGKGLEALIPRSFMSSGKTIMTVPLKEIKENPFQPRQYFDDDKINELCESIQEHGIIQPILVRRKGNYYELIAGERRFRACQKLKMDGIPAIVRDITDKESLQIALIENLHRADLDAIEVAKGYKRLIDEFSMTHDAIGKLFSKSRTAVTNTLRLLGLDPSIQSVIVKGEISEGHGRVLAGIGNKTHQDTLLQSILSDKLTVRQAEARSKKHGADSGNADDRLRRCTQLLSEKLGVVVSSSGSSKKGRLVIHFNSEAELQRVRDHF